MAYNKVAALVVRTLVGKLPSDGGGSAICFAYRRLSFYRNNIQLLLRRTFTKVPKFTDQEGQTSCPSDNKYVRLSSFFKLMLLNCLKLLHLVTGGCPTCQQWQGWQAG